MSQVVDFKLNVKEIEFFFLERLKNQFYNFNVKVLVSLNNFLNNILVT